MPTYSWKDLCFDTRDASDRAKFIENNGITLPIVHETAPIRHAELCREFSTGELGLDGISWRVFARVELNTALTIGADGAGRPHPDVDSSTLEETYETMLLVEAHTSDASQSKSDRPSKPPPSKPKTAARRRK